jgi:hypothetical protein
VSRQEPTVASTPTARRSPPRETGAVTAVACRPSCLLYGGCFTCAPLEHADEDELASGSDFGDGAGEVTL